MSLGSAPSHSVASRFQSCCADQGCVCPSGEALTVNHLKELKSLGRPRYLLLPSFRKTGFAQQLSFLHLYSDPVAHTVPKWPSASDGLFDVLSALAVPAPLLFTLFIAFISHLAIYFQLYTHLTLLLILKNDCSGVAREGRNK